MYKIIGADQKEYGPVTSDQVRQWIADGRANGHTQARAEGTQEWQPLSAFPEFAQALGIEAPVGAAPPPLTTQTDGRAAALQRVKAPAVALMVTAILNCLLAVWGLVSLALIPPNLHRLDSEMQQMNNPQMQELMQRVMHLTYGPFGIANDLFGLVMSVLILMGALRMKSLRSYEFSITAAILAMIPCLTPCCVFGLPFGIWALVVLRLPEIRSCFH